MSYAEKVPSPSGAYWRGRYLVGKNKYATVRDDAGNVIRFDGKQKAAKAAKTAEADARRGLLKDPSTVTVGAWSNTWYKGLSLAPSTMANIRRHVQQHILPNIEDDAGKVIVRGFEDVLLSAVKFADIERWAEENLKIYKPASVKTWRGTFHTLLEDAVPELIPVNPATQKRGRGRRAEKSANRSARKMIADPLTILLIAERMGILSGRDDEFVMTTLMQYVGLRLGETVGLEREYAQGDVRGRDTLRVEWQLYELASSFERCPPKDGSRRDVDMPPFLRSLLSGHLASVPVESCACHGIEYVFRGLGRPRGERTGEPTLRNVAAVAKVSPATVSLVLNGNDGPSEATRARVEEAVRNMRYVRRLAPDRTAAHWRRSSFEAMFTAAATGTFPPKAPLPERPVPLEGDWPGTRVTGRNCQGRATLRWEPLAPGLTPHGLRHSHKSWMHEKRIHEVLSEERLGHELAGIAGLYTHSTVPMRRDLIAALGECWTEALDARLAMSPYSPVPVLGRLLRERTESRRIRIAPSIPPETPEGVLPFPGRTPSDQRRGDRI